MYEEHIHLDYPFPAQHFRQAVLDRVDEVLLAVAGRQWEVTRDTTPHARQVKHTPWPIEEMRTSPLGQHLLLIADYANGGVMAPARVEQVMRSVLRTLFGDPLSEGYTLPSQFHTTNLGKLLNEASRRMYKRKDLMTPTQVSRELGVARQSVYDRITDGNLHPIYLSRGEMRLLRPEVEAWKAQRQQRHTSRS